jgi:GH15 family glucan-1,4-alpha-glucosidase
VRNWDYRYTWIRDASSSVYALRRIGFAEEAGAFLGWVLDTFEHAGAPKIMYELEGSIRLARRRSYEDDRVVVAARRLRSRAGAG